jgi:hypothetical protein
MKVEKTFRATISLGFRVGYSEEMHEIEEVEQLCHDKIGLCVTITPTTFIYSRRTITPYGWENGCFIELIQYPRFPDSEENIKNTALKLAKILMKNFGQTKVSVICTDNTYMLEPEDIV